jgi:RND family efflux transporter MFP subunit
MPKLHQFKPRVRATDAPLLALVICIATVFQTAKADTPEVDVAPLTVRGVVKAQAEATISNELIAKVASLPFAEGQAFRAGDTIVAFDCRRYQADLRAAQAEVETAAIKVKTNKALERHAAVGADELAISKAKLHQAEATAVALKLKTDQCIITAPFDGRVVELKINEHEIPQASSPLLHIVKEGELELELIVPSHWLVWLSPDQSFTFHIDELKRDVEASLQFLGATVDPISRTAMVSAKIINPGRTILPGMSGTATFEAPNG